MKQTSIFQGGLSIFIAITLFCFSPLSRGEENGDVIYKFNNNFIVGSHENVDLSRFSISSMSEGVYSLDVYTNGEWKGRYDIKTTADKNKKLGVCYTKEMLIKFGISPEKLNPQLSNKEDFCGRITEWRNEDNVKDTLIQSSLRLNISVPQIYEDQHFKNFVSDDLWDKGIGALNLKWMANAWNNHTSFDNSDDNNSAYLGINSSLSWNGWLIRSIGNLNWNNNDKINWNSNQTYLQRPIPQIKSILRAGQIYTNGEFFDSIGIRGVNLATDDNMYPDVMLSYAPEIRGVAQSNALVTVRQGNNIIYQTTVPPGPFVLQDVYPSGYGNELKVSVKESDGTVKEFSVPYASVAQLLRPGMTRYALSVGKVDDSYLGNNQMIYQGTWQHGFNNLFTGYTGITGFENYHSVMFGTGMNTGIGALSFDITYSTLKSKFTDDHGQSFRITFNRMFSQTNTSVLLAAYRYSSKGFYNLSNALNVVNQEKKYNNNNEILRQKNGITFTVNQQLPDGWGGIYLSGSVADYWNRKGKEKEYQFSYNNTFGRLSWSLNSQRVYKYNGTGRKHDDRISLNFSYPLSFGENRQVNMTSNSSFYNSHFSSSQIGINGSLDNENRINYGVSAITTTGGQNNIALNGSYRSQFASVSGSYSQGSGYRQSGMGASGTVIVHRHGVVFSSETGTTIALIEAKDAAGATIPGSTGTRIDRNGYAILSYLRPYRINSVEIDPKGSNDDVVFDHTIAKVIPWEDSVVKVSFDTKIQKNITMKAYQADGSPLPFASTIVDDSGKEIGVVGQGSMMFISDAGALKAIVKWTNAQCSVDLNNLKMKETICQ